MGFASQSMSCLLPMCGLLMRFIVVPCHVGCLVCRLAFLSLYYWCWHFWVAIHLPRRFCGIERISQKGCLNIANLTSLIITFLVALASLTNSQPLLGFNLILCLVLCLLRLIWRLVIMKLYMTTCRELLVS